MRVSDLALPGAATKFLRSQGYEELYPPQAAAVDAGLLGGKSLLVSAPTASGKTLVAMLAMLGHFARGGGRAVYLSPLRALASEKFLELKKLETIPLKTRIKAAVSTGDSERADRGLKSANVLVLTNEKMDSAMRHGAEWADDIGLVVADEVHLLGDADRGPTLEMILTQFKLAEDRPQLVGLSATITNSDELASWLGCGLVRNDWRPVPLAEGVCYGGEVEMNDGRTFPVKKSVRGTPVDLGIQAVLDGGQSLLFAETRTRARSLATKAADAVQRSLGAAERRDLASISRRILSENENTDMVRTLAELVSRGVAFHHAGLGQSCRTAVEEGFRGGAIRLLSSTPTLAAGVNLPARRVVISSTNRYNPREGINMPISVMEYKQLCGRAGRPQYDEYGESIIVAGTSADGLAERYIGGVPEPVESGITEDRSLRTHVLSVIVRNPGIKRDGILEFFMQTLGGLQSRRATVRFAIDVSLRFLINQSLAVKKGDRYAATAFGKKTSMLYLDPMTAVSMRDAAASAPEEGAHTLGFLHMISECEEFFPRMGLRNRDREAAAELLEEGGDELLEPVYECSRSLLALHSWISEATELHLSDALGVESGDMHRMAETAAWLCYCTREIAKHAGRADLLSELGDLRERIRYGISPELLGLVRVRGIGRVRARALYRAGIRTVADLKKAPEGRLAGIGRMGPATAKKIKSGLAGAG